jgi:hypothetical protein
MSTPLTKTPEGAIDGKPSGGNCGGGKRSTEGRRTP